MSKTKQPARTSARHAKGRADNQQSAPQDMDGVFFLKLVLYLLLGASWLKLSHGASLNIPLPLGLVIGLFFTSHEHFQIDRKIEYAVLLVAMLIGYFAPFGLYVSY